MTWILPELNGARHLHSRDFGSDGGGILITQGGRCPGSEPHPGLGDIARNYNEQVRAQTADLGGDLLPCPCPDRHHGDHCRHPDDDAEHRQGTAQLVQAERIKGRQDGVKVGHGVTELP